MRYVLGGLAPVMVLWACGGSQGEPAKRVVRLDAEERASYEAALERMRDELDEALTGKSRAEEALTDARLGIDATQGGRTARLEQELEVCQGDLGRYRQGLERAVEELNDRHRAPQAVPVDRRRSGSPSAAPQAPRRDYGRVHVNTPLVRVLGLGVLVEYSFYSTRDSATEGTAVIRLLEDGRELDVERQPAKVAAHSRWESSVMFHRTTNPTGIYTAEISLEDRKQ